MSNEPGAVSLEEISKWIRDAASGDSWRPGHHLGSGQVFVPETSDFHGTRILASLHRARLKTFVRMAKPFRRIFRNQGAVNDSLIEAVHHLAAQNQEMMGQMSELRALVNGLRSQTRRTPPPETTPQSRAGEAPALSAGKKMHSIETLRSPAPEASDRDGSCA